MHATAGPQSNRSLLTAMPALLALVMSAVIALPKVCESGHLTTPIACVSAGLLAWFAALAIARAGASGLFHAGGEYGWWPGITSCAVIAGGGSGNALEDIMNTPLVRCDEPAWTLAGISLPGYNFLVSSAAALAIFVLMVKDRNA